MCSFILLSTARTATLIAFLIARGDDLPCEMMLTPLHAEQRRAAMLGVVELLERASQSCRFDAGGLLEEADDHRRDGLVELEHDVADEAVADDDVECAASRLASRQVAPLDVADEVESSGGEELRALPSRRRCPSPAPRRC